MTLAQLQASAVQTEVAKEALAHAEKRLADLLETKKSFELRASTLLTGFTTLALAVVGAGGGFLTSTVLAGSAPKALPYAFFVASLPLMVAAWCMVRVLRPAAYGNLGSAPGVWLQPGVINAGENVVPVMQAYVTHSMKERIDKTNQTNDARAQILSCGCNWALAAPGVLAIGILLSVAFAK